MLAHLTLLAVIIASLGSRWPLRPTEPTELSDARSKHVEVLRVTRDFGANYWHLVVDGWMPAHGGELEEVRLWWANVKEHDKRFPFSRKELHYVSMSYERKAATAWNVTFAGDGKSFTFSVELDGNSNTANAYADIFTDDSTVVEHCRVLRSRMIARRFIGIPVGLRGVRATCIDADGRRHRGMVSYYEA